MNEIQQLCGPTVAWGRGEHGNSMGTHNVNVIEMWPDHSCIAGIVKEMAEVVKVTTRTQNYKTQTICRVWGVTGENNYRAGEKQDTRVTTNSNAQIQLYKEGG